MDNVCVPLHLDAFALSPACCEGESEIAPYTQPNYTALRLDSHLIQHDVLDHVDFHTASPASKNPRLADIGLKPGPDPKLPKNLKPNRMGVHLHWSLPRLYRAASANGRDAKTQGTEDPSQPKFPSIPNRWLVIRRLQNYQQVNFPEFQSWVVESNTVRKIKDIPDNVDLESDVSPFVSNGAPNDDNIFKAQTEIFLGQKFDLAESPAWSERNDREHMPNLTLMNSSNPIFPDYALHNTNVLSIIDNFSFPSGPDKKGVSYLENAVCDYYVIGWHQDSGDDPFNKGSTTDMSTRLTSMRLKLDDNTSEDILTSEIPTRCLIHGAIYNVKYDSKQKPPTSLADLAAQNFTDEDSTDKKTAAKAKMEPLSIGTTSLDGILTFLEAHKTDADSIFGTGAQSLATSLLEIEQLLYASADNYDARVQAQDLIAQQNFSKVEGGLKWVFGDTTTPGSSAKQPTPADADWLVKLNEAQMKLDASKRKLRSLQWDLFAEWWKFVSQYISPKLVNSTAALIKTNAVDPLKKDIGKVQDLIKSLNSDILNVLTPKVVGKTATKDPYRLRTDPTLCIAGLDSGWPADFADVLRVRLDPQLMKDTNIADTIFKGAGNPIPAEHGLDKTARKLLSECIQNAVTKNGIDGAPNITGYQAWGDRNPFVPLFIEWEATYYHIDPLEKKWDVQLRPSPVGHAEWQVRYAPKDILSKDNSNKKDMRTLSGRIVVLPQPVFSLEAAVLQVLDSASGELTLTPAENDQPDSDSGKILVTQTERDNLRKNIRQIKFISAPLSGLTNHLLTRCEGAHVKPNARAQGQKVTPLQAAAREAIGLPQMDLGLIDGESALTPYGNLLAFGQDEYPGRPFKPVTHGQMILTKINIIDKFGQAICMPKTARRPRVPPDTPASNIYPCLSDYLSPNVVDSGLNTVWPTADPVEEGQWPLCQYIELTPSINQEARINASFLVRDQLATGGYSNWRETTDYDQPIWGWVVINYADNGLQFFYADGTFYREIRKGGVSGTTLSNEWLPSSPPVIVPTDAASAQLKELIEKVKDPEYFQKFSDMINGSIPSMPFPPSDYSGYANSIIGKPLALVNAGWSLELAAPAIKPQNSLGNKTDTPQADLEGYSFPLKIGDIARNYDGVVGYWLSQQTKVRETDWSTVYTYFVVDWENLPPGHIIQLPGTTQPLQYTVITGDTPDSIATKFKITLADLKAANPGIPEATSDFRPISPNLFPKLHPYYLDPVDYIGPADGPPIMTQAKVAKYTITTLLVDPYTTIHGYSPVLPITQLTVPPWSIRQAFQNMHAFFHLGPILLTDDMPATHNAAEADGTVVNLPVSGRKGTWSWLQPYVVDGPGLDPTYAQIEVQEDLGQKKYAKPPYTFIEGYLQLMGSLSQDAVKSATANS